MWDTHTNEYKHTLNLKKSQQYNLQNLLFLSFKKTFIYESNIMFQYVHMYLISSFLKCGAIGNSIYLSQNTNILTFLEKFSSSVQFFFDIVNILLFFFFFFLFHLWSDQKMKFQFNNLLSNLFLTWFSTARVNYHIYLYHANIRSNLFPLSL